MRKKALSIVLALAMVATLFGGMQKEALAIDCFFCITEDNLDKTDIYDAYEGTGRYTILENIELPWLPGDIIKPGTPIDFELDFWFMDEPFPLTLPNNTFNYCGGDGYDEAMADFHAKTSPEILYYSEFYRQSYGFLTEYDDYIDEVIDVPAGYDAWKVQMLAEPDCIFYFLYPVKLAPDAPEVRDCELASQNGTTTWKDYYGKTVWTITEKEDSITADLTDWAAIPDAIVKAWKESGKAINVSYVWKGYSVSLSIPAGEIARTGEEWYGAEYLVKANEQYAAVKDWFGQTVSTDVLFK